MLTCDDLEHALPTEEGVEELRQEGGEGRGRGRTGHHEAVVLARVARAKALSEKRQILKDSFLMGFKCTQAQGHRYIASHGNKNFCFKFKIR